MPRETGTLNAKRRRSLVELRWQIWTVWAGVAVMMWSAARTDPDLWGHVRFGLDWLDTRTLPTVDPYSFTQDRAWVNHEWLSEAFMGLAYRIGGGAGLVLLKAVVMALAIAVVAWRLRGSTPLVMSVFLTIAIVCLLPTSTTIRPQLWSVLGLTLLVPLMDGGAPDARRILGGAALFAIWANFHGGWITGVAVLGTFAGIRVLRSFRDAPRWIALALASAIATLINPYGVGLWLFLATTVRTSRPDISEWQPLSFDEPLIIWLSIVVALALPLLLMRERDNRPTLEAWGVIVVLVIGGVRVSRVAPLIAPVVIALLGPNIRSAWGDTWRLTAANPAAAAIFFLPGIIVLATTLMTVPRLMGCIPIADWWAPDLHAAARLRGSTGRLWSTFDWGEYAIWHFGPALRVSIDGRRETVYSDDVVQLHRAFDSGSPEAQAVFLKHSPDYVWLRASQTSVKQWLVKNGYRIDEENASSFVAVRADRPPLPPAKGPLPACFP